MNSAVFDTNVIVSGMTSPHGPPGRIVEWLRSGWVKAVMDDRIFDEYACVLKRPAFRLPKDEVDVVLDAIRRNSSWVTAKPSASSRQLPDPDDMPFLECAMVGTEVLVTGNIRHYPASLVDVVRIVTPADYVNAVGQEV